MPAAERDREIVEYILRYCKQIDTAHEDFGYSRETFDKSTTYQNAVSHVYPANRGIGQPSIR